MCEGASEAQHQAGVQQAGVPRATGRSAPMDQLGLSSERQQLTARILSPAQIKQEFTWKQRAGVNA